MRASHQEPLLDIIYACAIRDDALPIVLAQLAKRYGCVAAALLYIDPDRPDAYLSVLHGVITSVADHLYSGKYADDDPAPAAMARLDIGQAAATDRLFPPATTKPSRFLVELYHPLGLRETLGGPVAKDGRRFGILAVHRGEDRASFTDVEIADFEGLISHVARALDLRRKFYEIQTNAQSLHGMLDAMAGAVAVVDRLGQVKQANRAARSLLARNDGIGLSKHGSVTIADPGTAATFHKAIERGRLKRTELIRVPRHGSEKPYVMRLAPFRERAGDVVITMFDPRLPASDHPDIIASAMQVSIPVARLVAALSNGTTLNEYAGQAGISINTAKFHLKAAFAATGTRRQTELVGLALGLIREFSG